MVYRKLLICGRSVDVVFTCFFKLNYESLYYGQKVTVL